MTINNEPSSKPVSKKTVPRASFVKLAMKNMVRKGSQSIMHFTLTAVGLLGFLFALAWFFRPNLPN